MFITCQECNTTYRLDERLLQPAGSKVRCSQCRHVFIAQPPVSQPIEVTDHQQPGMTEASAVAMAEVPGSDTTVTEQELEGIDLAELDALLAQEALPVGEPNAAETMATEDTEGPPDDTDLDFDFESALEPPAEEPPPASADDADRADALDLDMDFEIHDDTLVIEHDGSDAATALPDVGASADIVLPDDDLAFEDLDLGLEEGDLSEVEAPSVTDQGQGQDDLDLAALDFDMAETDASSASESDDLDLSLEDDLDLASTLEGDFEAADNDLALSLDHDLELIDEPSADKPVSDDLDFSLEDDLDLAGTPAGDSEAADEDIELSLDDDLELVDEPSAGKPVSDDLDFSLEDDLDLAGTPAGDSEAADEDIELSLDDDLELVDEPSAGAPVSDDPAFSLDDDFGLDDDASAGASESDDLDLSLADDLDLTSAPAAGPQAGLEDEPLSLDDDFDLSFEEPAAEASAQENQRTEDQASLDDDLDLSDLDALMATTGLDDEGPGGAHDDLDLELTLDDDTAASDKTPEPDTASDDLTSLDFQLDDDTELQPDKPSARAGDTLAEDEIDLSDIERMLEGDTSTAKEKKPTAPLAQEELGFGGSDELDLADIESAIDEADLLPERKTDGDAFDDEELELEFDLDADDTAKELDSDQLDGLTMESSASSDLSDLALDLDLEETPAKGMTRAGATGDEEEELDLSDLSDLVDEKDDSASGEIVHGGDIELEFLVEDDDQQSEGRAVKDRKSASAAAPQARAAAVIEENKAPAPPKPKPFRTKKKTSKSLVLLLILALLGGGGYGLYYAVEEQGIEIPYVGDYVKQAVDYFKPAPQDPQGILNLSTSDITSKFIENSEAGRLFIITGTVRNGYNTPREMIRVQGRLYTRGKVLAKTEFSYAGIQLDDQDLANQPLVEINQLLKTPPRDAGAGTTARPGQTVPFTLVFADLPPADQLDEFAVEPVSSAPGN